MNQTNFQCLPKDNLFKVMNALPPQVAATLIHYPQLFVAGGFIRAVLAGEPVKDIDIFSTDLTVVDRAVDFCLVPFNSWKGGEKRRTPYTITVDVVGQAPIQFINNVAYATPEECVSRFDFTVCQAAIWRDIDGVWRSLCTPEFIRDVADKRLVYTAPVRVEAPGGSLWRAFKFAQRGYSISQQELARLVNRLVSRTPWVDDDGEHIRKSFSMGGGRYF